MEWEYDEAQDQYLCQIEDQQCIMVVKPSKGKERFVLHRVWTAPQLDKVTDYIGTFKDMGVAKKVAELIVEG